MLPCNVVGRYHRTTIVSLFTQHHLCTRELRSVHLMVMLMVLTTRPAAVEHLGYSMM